MSLPRSLRPLFGVYLPYHTCVYNLSHLLFIHLLSVHIASKAIEGEGEKDVLNSTLI